MPEYVIKVKYNERKYRVSMNNNKPSLALTDLKAYMVELLHPNEGETLSLKWQDPEGDIFDIDFEDGLKEAIKVMTENGSSNTLNFIVDSVSNPVESGKRKHDYHTLSFPILSRILSRCV